MGLVELTRKRQGQNIYELFGKKCDSCGGLGHIENLPNYQNSNTESNHSPKKSSKLNNTKSPDFNSSQEVENQEKIVKKELTNSKNLIKDDDNSKKKENDNELLNTNNSREKKVITVELTNAEKIVFSQLGINPLIKLGKEYLTNNHFALLEDSDNKEKVTSIEKNKKLIKKVTDQKANKKTSTPNSTEKVEVILDESKDLNSENKLQKEITENKDIELIDEIDQSRRKRRRSSASNE